MDIYLVRHGQTDGNVAHRHQHPDTKLNDVGKAQAALVALKLKELKPTHLITSTQMRAVETARIIGATCGLVPETYPPFEELHRPQFHVGTRLVGPITLWYMVRWFFGDTSASMHDGETYAAFLGRLRAARQQLETLPPTARVVVVSHSVFINFFVAHLCHPKPMSFMRAGITFAKILLLKNSSVTHVRYTKTAAKKGCGWRVIER